MAEGMTPITHNPDSKMSKAYGEWADGNWGMILTGKCDI
jgi:2,4-dienoyl-CoA reductase-like NADH-dependent reductase (Old Yellow Enzyme family)